jgi:hypothetical protein
MKKLDVIIHIEEGIVQAVYADQPDLRVDVMDTTEPMDEDSEEHNKYLKEMLENEDYADVHP